MTDTNVPNAAQPAEGGSYIRKEDGSLERVAFTDDRRGPAAAVDAKEAEATPTADAEPASVPAGDQEGAGEAAPRTQRKAKGD